MRRRRLIRAVALVSLFGAAAFVLRPQPSRITREDFDRIAPPMSRAEVYALLGPPGDYTTGPVTWGKGLGHSWTDEMRLDKYSGYDNWNTDALFIRVYYDATGSVIGDTIT